MSSHNKIYRAILSLLGKESLTRGELISACFAGITGTTLADAADIGEATRLKGQIGSVINEMTENGVIARRGDLYTAAAPRSVALRAEYLEKQILELLQKGPRSKAEIRNHLVKYFGTDKTPSIKDDSILYTLNGQVLKRLTRLGVVLMRDGSYILSEKSASRIDDINAMLALKADFLTRIHASGGEFFEHFIMTLLGKYLSKCGKTVTSNRVMGGSADGGIDGIITTVDQLGFKETVMVQAKNRLESANETTVRGFYGAVCAALGSRGIFATTSDFHPNAAAFLDGIDNCVGVDGDKIFRMAIECQYGLVKRRGKYEMDSKIFK